MSEAADLLPTEAGGTTGPGGRQLYIRLLPANETVLLSWKRGQLASAGVTGQHDLSGGDEPVVAFTSRSDNLGDGDPEPHRCADASGTPVAVHCADVYVSTGWYLNGSPAKVSVGLDGEPANGDSVEVRLSDVDYNESNELTGRLVFTSFASNLVAGDTVGSLDVFAVDVVTQTVRRLTVGDVGGRMDGLAISADATTVAVASSSDLDPDVGTPGTHVFLIDAATGDATALGLPGESFAPSLSSDGRVVAFLTDEALVAEDDNGGTDAYLLDLSGGDPVLLSQGSDGQQTGTVHRAEVSGDGATVVFSAPGGLDPEAPNPLVDHVYARRVASGAIQAVNVSDPGQPAPAAGASMGPRSISPDGSRVAFATADPLEATDTNGTSDVYLRSLYGVAEAVLDPSGAPVSFGGDATQGLPVALTIDPPAGLSGIVTASLRPGDPFGAPQGYALLDPAVGEATLVLSGPAAPFNDPHVLTFTVDGSLTGGLALADIQVFRDGAAVPDCADETSAVPDPCVASREPVGGDAVLTVRTSRFSTWSIGRLDYDLAGPLRPVEASSPNPGIAGLPVVVPFRLGGDRGKQVLSGAPTVAACTGSAAAAPLAARSWRLDYVRRTDAYLFTWLTPRSAKGCRELVLSFRDGSELSVQFRLR
jgi:hypothetical protein